MLILMFRVRAHSNSDHVQFRSHTRILVLPNCTTFIPYSPPPPSPIFLLVCPISLILVNVDNVDTDEEEEFEDYEWDLEGYHADKPVQPDFGQPSPNAPKGSFNFGKASSSSSSSSCSSSFSFGAPKKCKATTAKGLPCARGAKVEGLCTQHFKLGQSNIHVHVCNKDDNKSHNMAKTKLKIQDDKVLQCAATTKKGKRCSNKARFSGFCGLHKKNSDDVIDHLDNIMNQMNL